MSFHFFLTIITPNFIALQNSGTPQCSAMAVVLHGLRPGAAKRLADCWIESILAGWGWGMSFSRGGVSVSLPTMIHS